MKIQSIIQSTALASVLLITVFAYTKGSKTLDVYWVDVDEKGEGTLIVTPADELILTDRGLWDYRNSNRTFRTPNK